jgi:hypothetical protein
VRACPCAPPTGLAATGRWLESRRIFFHDLFRPQAETNQAKRPSLVNTLAVVTRRPSPRGGRSGATVVAVCAVILVIAIAAGALLYSYRDASTGGPSSAQVQAVESASGSSSRGPYTVKQVASTSDTTVVVIPDGARVALFAPMFVASVVAMIDHRRGLPLQVPHGGVTT